MQKRGVLDTKFKYATFVPTHKTKQTVNPAFMFQNKTQNNTSTHSRHKRINCNLMDHCVVYGCCLGRFPATILRWDAIRFGGFREHMMLFNLNLAK